MGVTSNKLQSIGGSDILTVTMIGDETETSVTWPGGDLEEDRTYKLILTFLHQFKVQLASSNINFGVNIAGSNNFAAAIFSRGVRQNRATQFSDAIGEEFPTSTETYYLSNPEAARQLRGLILPPGLGITIGVGSSGVLGTVDFNASMLVATARDPIELWPFIGDKQGISGKR